MAECFYGIDFGTTNSAVFGISTINNEINDEFSIGEDDRLPLPSFVAINIATGDVVTGKRAKESIINIDNNEYQVFPSIKSIIGSEESWNIAGKNWTPIEIATELFKSLKHKAEATTNMEMKEAVVAVPIGFDSKKRFNVRKAAHDAGIEVKMLVSEPTAAFCGRKDEMKKFRNVAVFDWGGGTLDVVVLKIEKNIVHEIATGGMPIAGNDIDKKLADKIILNSAEKKGMDFSFDNLPKDVQQRILIKCEIAKCNLADEDIVEIYDARLGEYGRLNESISYDYFKLLIENEVQQAVSCLLKVLADAGMNRETIDCILCEGGSSRLRPLQRELLKYFDRDKLKFPLKAMWDIAAGVAQISYKPGCYTLNKPIGIIQSNNKFHPLLKQGQRIPTEEKTVKFGLVESTDEARIIFSDGEDNETQTFSEYFPIKIRNFSNEALAFSFYVDPDMVFRLKVRSSYTPDEYLRVWTYSDLKVSYEIDAPEPEQRDANE